jgi:hypothetical protein
MCPKLMYGAAICAANNFATQQSGGKMPAQPSQNDVAQAAVDHTHVAAPSPPQP